MSGHDDLNNRRNWIAVKLCNLILNTVATKTYRDIIDGSIRMGLTAAVTEVKRRDRNNHND